MRKTYLALVCFLLIAPQIFADTLAQWNFNSVPPDAASTTGSTVPSVGAGTVNMVGGATNIFSSGNGSSDPTPSDDTALHTSNYAAQNTGNKSRGVEVRVSTVGFESLIITWDQRQSPTANRYTRFQYSTDGVNFVDSDVLTTDVPDVWVTGRTVNLGSILGVNNNANFAFRLVSEFQDTATGSGTAGYVATSATSSYSQNGTVRFDLLTVSATPATANNFPTITAISNQTIRVDTATAPLPFTVGDVETPVDQLNVTGTSSNPTLVPPEGIVLEGTGADRTVTIGPAFDETGTSTITLTVTDGEGKSTSTSFLITVLPNNIAPTISAVTNVHTLMSTPFAPVTLTVADPDESADTLVLSASSSDQTVVADAGIAISGSGADRTLTIAPVAGATGTAVITATVTDNGGLTATVSFNAMVVPSSNIVFAEPFNYPDGPLLTGSGRLWTTRAGTIGQMQVILGTLQVTGTQTEDVVARLIGAPYETSGATELYASFDVTFSTLPGNDPDIFAHFSGTVADNLRARVLASTTNAQAGFFRLGIANTTSTAANVTDYPLDLEPNTTYQVVVGYNVAAGSSRLWVNPASGGGSVSASDGRLPTPINSYGFRQSTRVGDMRIDNLLVGLSFEDVTPNLTRVRIRRSGNAVEVSWPSDASWEGYILESTQSLANPDWQQVNEATVPVDGWDVVTIPNPSGDRYFRLKKP